MRHLAGVQRCWYRDIVQMSDPLTHFGQKVAIFVRQVQTLSRPFNAVVICRFSAIRFDHQVRQRCAAGNPGFVATQLHAAVVVQGFDPGQGRVILSVLGNGKGCDAISREFSKGMAQSTLIPGHKHPSHAISQQATLHRLGGQGVQPRDLF